MEVFDHTAAFPTGWTPDGPEAPVRGAGRGPLVAAVGITLLGLLLLLIALVLWLT